MGRLHQHRSWCGVGALSTAGVDPQQHDYRADSDTQHQARGLAGQLWQCRQRHRPRTKVDNGCHEPRDAVLAAQVDQ